MGEIVAWLHTINQKGGQKWVRVTLSPKNPWGEPGKDYSAEYPVTTEPLVRAPARCLHCDGTGDVHGIDGEWRASCSCQSAARSARFINEGVHLGLMPTDKRIFENRAGAVDEPQTWRDLDDKRLQLAIDAFYEPCEGTTIDGVRAAILAWEQSR